MLSKYVMPGNRMEIQEIERAKNNDSAETRKTYQTRVVDIVSEDRLEVMMPMEKTKLILLPVNAQFDLYFYTSSGVFQCFANVIDRYKSNNQYILLMELTSNLRRFQRREYYRLSCALEMSSRPLEKEEIESIENNNSHIVPGLPLKRSVIVDISGGGIRFVANYAYEPDSLIYCKYKLMRGGSFKEYVLISKVLSVRKLDNRPGIFEHRAQYINIDTEDREEIIRFIFEEERKCRKKEKGL